MFGADHEKAEKCAAKSAQNVAELRDIIILKSVQDFLAKVNRGNNQESQRDIAGFAIGDCRRMTWTYPQENS